MNTTYQGGRVNVSSLPNSGMARTLGESPRTGERAALPVLFNGSQPAANPPPNLPNPAGCLLSEGERYALEQAQDGPPEVIAYADRRGV